MLLPAEHRFPLSFRKKTCSGRELNLIFQTAFPAVRRTQFHSEDIHVPAGCGYFGADGAPLYHLTPSAPCFLKIFFSTMLLPAEHRFSPSFRKKTCSGREHNLIFQTAFSAARRTQFYSEDIHVPAGCGYFGADGGAVVSFNSFRSLHSQNIFSLQCCCLQNIVFPKFSQENLQRAGTQLNLSNCIPCRPSNSAHLHSFRSAIKYGLRIDEL